MRPAKRQRRHEAIAPAHDATESPRQTLQDLPGELLEEVFGWCSASDLVRLSATCKEFAAIIDENDRYVPLRRAPRTAAPSRS